MTDPASTDDLLRRLASSPPPVPLKAGALVAPMLACLLVAVLAFLALIGLRADPLTALTRPEVAAKSLLPLTLSAIALVLALRSARPGRRVVTAWLALPAALAATAFVLRLLQAPPDRIIPELLGSTAAACLLSITLLSAPAIALGLVLFRRGATLRPALTGALIGMAVSGGAAAGYALHCTEDSPLFFTIWYGLAILICTAGGAVAGAKARRW